MPGWDNFFQGELGAAAALAGLLFVSVSVNQARILELGRMADRGLEALAMLAGLVPLQRGYLRHLDQVHRSRSTHLVRFNQLAIALVALGGLLLAWRSDMAGLYALAAGILLIFIGAGANAWVLLIEINR